jgi:photosystem II stability/assembly factor-like uncharacterized protein
VHRLFRLTSFSVILLALLIAADVGAIAARAQDDSADGLDWGLTGLSDPVVRLFTPASGAFFAQTAMTFLRSDDGGSTWRSVSLGPATTILNVDPNDHTILFAAGPDGVYKTSDDAATWQLIFPYGQDVGRNALALAVSPADHNVLYLGVTMMPGISSDFRFFRSQDGGATWRRLEEHHFSLCGWGMAILQPHPTDAGRVFRAAECTAGRNFGESLNQSTNAGDAWTAAWTGNTSESAGYPRRLVGGQGAAPGRFYLAVNRDRRVGGSSLYRSDDDGATWNAILVYHGGGTQGYGEDPQAPGVELGGLAYDPSNPDRVYVGRQVYPSYSDPPDGGAVAASFDGGATWSDLGRQDIGAVSDLALGVDGRNLYAATDHGLWQLRLDDPT